MRFADFFGSPVTQAWLTEAIRADLTSNQEGNRAAQLFPRTLQDVSELNKRVIALPRPIIAADVAPLSQGRQGGGLSKQHIRGTLIDSAAKYHYQGADIEDLRYLLSAIEAIPGDTVSLRTSNLGLEAAFGFMRTHVTEPLYMNMNRKDWTLLRTGKAWADGSRDDDFTRPPLMALYGTEQTTVVTAGATSNIYGGADADFFNDYQSAVNRARARGWRIREAVMNSNTRQQILGLESTKIALGGKTLDVSSGGQVQVRYAEGAATTAAFDTALADRQLPGVVIEDGFWQDQVREAGDPAGAVGTYVMGAYVPDGVVILIPESRPEERAFIQNEMLLAGLPAPTDGTAVGIHLIGRPTAQDEGAKIYTFGPYYERSENPSIRGSGIAAHMPFLAGPAGFEVLEYAKP